MKDKQHTSGGVSIGGLFQLALIVLKLCGVIDWSWWYVLAPSWVGLLVGAIWILAGILLIAISDHGGK